MTFPALPAAGNASWLPWATAVHGAVAGGVSAARSLDWIIATDAPYGAVADYNPTTGTGTDNAVALQAACDAAAAQKSPLYIPPGRYRTTYAIRHPAGGDVFGAGPGQTFIHNTYGGASSWLRGPTWACGTYTSGATSTATEASYPINVAGLGQITATCTTATDAAHFLIGDVVCLAGPTVSSIVGNPGLPNEINRVTSSDPATGIVGLEYPITDDLPAGSLIYRLNDGGVTSVFGGAAAILDRGSLAGLTLSNTHPGYQTLHVNALGTSFADLTVIGARSLAGNPVARCTFDNVEMRYNDAYGYQGAYCSHDTVFTNCRWVRTGGTGRGPWLANLEGAKSHRFLNCAVDDVNAGAGEQSVLLADRSEWIGGRIVGNAVGPVVVGDRCLLDGALIVATAGGDGVNVPGVDAKVRRTRVRGTTTGKNAIHLGTGSRDCRADDNILGVRGARVVADTILDEGQGNKRNTNQTYATMVDTHLLSAQTIQATTDTVIAATSYTAGTVQSGQGIRVRVHGSTTGAAGTKTVKIKLSAATMLTLNVSGDFQMEGVVEARGSNAGFAYRFLCFDGATVTAPTGSNAQARTANNGMSVTGVVANAADSLVIYACDVEWLYRGTIV